MSALYPAPAVLTADQALELLDKGAQRLFGYGADEFTRRWDLGEFASCDRAAITELGFLVSFTR